uniref:ZC3H15/TMA46 family C-terminal domain-containing protein n=2 Tax=Phaeomonas parva TaxID=124430 RepID=A0A7S1XRX3_9STRA|mmetsp:Transcript_31696/g.100696  ORF Transcript_31696/g.100696 Transcript_31696/m.100696 type:complete len:828 (+) Transcript_31696:750-3233(+)
MTVVERIEAMREELHMRGETGTPVTAETFAKWKADRAAAAKAQAEEKVEKELKKGARGKGLSVLTGRELFEVRSELFRDDANASAAAELVVPEDAPESEDEGEEGEGEGEGAAADGEGAEGAEGVGSGGGGKERSLFGIVRMGSRVETAHTLPFLRMVLCWILLVMLFCGTGIWLAERGGTDITFVDAVFLAANGVTATGLYSVDVVPLTALAKVLIILSVQLGSSTMISLVPVSIRIRSLRSVLPDAENRTFDLRRFRRVPQWLVEYKALVILRRMMLAYQAIVYLGLGSAIYVHVASTPHLTDLIEQYAHTDPLTWSIFHTISAYNNAGFSLQAASMIHFADYPAILTLISVVCLLGNIMLPVVLRWTLVVASFLSAKDSSRKVYFRYLLLNGRDIYSNIFVSQQTWILLITQLSLITVQLVITQASSAHLDVYEDTDFGGRFAISFFEAVNTRHAGLTVFNLTEMDPSVLVLYLLMMFLAPVPFMVVLRSSTNATLDNTDEMLDLRSERIAVDPMSSSVMSMEEKRLMHNDAYGIKRPGSAMGMGSRATSFQAGTPRHAGSVEASPGHSGALMGHSGVLGPPMVPLDERKAAEPEPTIGDEFGVRQLRRADSSFGAGAGEVTDFPAEGVAEGGGNGERSSYTNSTRMVNVHLIMRQKQILETQKQLRQRINSGNWRDEDYVTDTRVLLMVAYPNEKVPYFTRVTTRVKAVGWHLRHLAFDFVNSVAVRDLVLLWLSWYLISATGGRGNAASMIRHQFALLFELVSAYGNVGLSLGSVDDDNPNTSFSGNLSAFGKLCIICVSVLGALRGMPLKVGANANSSPNS